MPKLDSISAAEATRILDVKRATLYAYVSRGLIRSYTQEGGREKHYSREDVERLKVRQSARAGQGALAASALRWGEPVLDSSITRIDKQGPFYRGYSAVQLADRRVPFENVCELLWSGLLPETAMDWHIELYPLDAEPLRQSPMRQGEPNQYLNKMMAYLINNYALQTADPDKDLLHSLTKHARTLMHLISHHLYLLRKGARADDLPAQISLAHRIGNSLMSRPSQAAVQLINQGLILSADHELTPSAFAARVAASTGADLFSCLTSATGALAGPRHGGVFQTLEALVEELETTRPETLLARLKRRGETLPGFAHSLYEGCDPRADLLIRSVDDLGAPASGPYNNWRRLIQLAPEMEFGYPSIDTALVLAQLALGWAPGSAGAIFALGRMAGWTAHIIEQRLSGFMVRPRARYIGR